MVKQLFDMKQIDKEIAEHGAERSITLTLDKFQIEEWKEKGYFRHIRNELSIMPGLVFACVQTKERGSYYICSYHFLCPTEAIANRTYRMLNRMLNYNDVQHLVDCKSIPISTNSKPIRDGNVSACTLF